MLDIYLIQAWHNIKSHLLRSFLTLLGVLVGTAAVVALLTGSELATESALNQFKRLGVDLVSVSLSDGNSQQSYNDSLKSVQAIKAPFTPDIVNTIPYTQHYSPVIFNRTKVDTSILGVTEDMQSVMRFSLNNGRFISSLDKSAFFCVLGYELAKNLNKESHELIGSQIRINDFYFTIIGVMAESERSLFLMADPNQSVYIPIDNSLSFYKDAKIYNILYRILPGTELRILQEKIEQHFHQINPEIKLSFISPEMIIENMQHQNRTFKLLLGFIGGVSLFVGGIGVMNIMLVSVTERRREIGIRIAVGAKKKDILQLFLAEAAILTLIGGILGSLLGETIGYSAAKISHWDYHFLFAPIAIGFCVSLLVGLFFGLYPAKKAAELDPIEILRAQ